MSRWRPTRAGITNVWRYFDEVFTFDRGRLLLRGPNGSGKSKALEVLLPFLLDASMLPSRLSTFGTTARTMHWNLMGEGATGRTRVGFVWLEFHRDEGETVTIGARLQATRESTRVEPVYFITRLHIPDELHLVDEHGTPLSSAGLDEAIRGHGDVFRKAQEYRTAVRELLFHGMSADRYDTLIQALLQLRRPKLSEHLDPEALSGLLSSALPQVDELQIRELAEGFERLDQQRTQLTHLGNQERAARDLVAAVAAYSRAEIRVRAVELTQATTNLDSASAAVRHGQERIQAERDKAAAAQQREWGAASRGQELTGSKQALERSDAYAEGRNLDDLRRRAADARSIADRTAGDATQAGQRSEGSRMSADAADQSSAAQHRALSERVENVETAAMAAALTAPGDPVAIEPPPTNATESPDRPNPAERWRTAADAGLADVEARTRARHGQIEDVLRLLDDHDQAIRERGRSEEDVDHARQRLDAATEAVVAASQRFQLELADHEAAVLGWTNQLRALELERASVESALDETHEALSAGTPGEGGENALRELVGAAASAVREADGRRQGELAAHRAALQSDLDVTGAERDRLAAARFAEPERSGWRDAPAVQGAPLWQLVDSRPDAPADQVAAVEAALQAAGLLDAWVRPDGSVHLAGNDVILSAAESAGHERDTLLELLKPDPAESGVPHQIIVDILASVGLLRADVSGSAEPHSPSARSGSEATWVATDGRWRIGVQHGRWTKPQAEYLGAAARERHRHARLAELAADLADLGERIGRLDDELEQLAAHVRHAADEAAALPSDTAARLAATGVTRATDKIQPLERLHLEAVEARTAAELKVSTCWTRVEADTGRSRLPTQRDQLVALASDLTMLLTATGDVRRLAEAFVVGVDRAQYFGRAAAEDAAAWIAQRGRAAEDEAAARTLAAELEALDASHGTAYREVIARIAELAASIEVQHAVQKEESDARQQAENEVIRLKEQARNAEGRHGEALQRRDEAQAEFAWIVGTLLADDAGIGERAELDGDRVRPTLDLARQVLRDVGADGPAVAELTTRMTEQVRRSENILADRALVELTPERDVMITSALHGGRRTPVRLMLDAVAAERSRTEQEITEAQQSLFRRILTGDTRRHLSSRIRDAKDLVRDMNTRLTAVRTSSEVKVRLVWDVRKDEGDLLARARELLLTTPDRISDDDEHALVDFLADRIARAREADDGLPWAQQLAKVFDYTAWHQFRVQMKRGEASEWKLLTKQVHSALSGGEKAIALHLPLFAALAALYETTPQAPRFILLDEVFVGIDTANRGQIFGLLTDLALDVFLTSDHEWAAYPQVDGIAIHALAADDDDEAVTSTRFVWTGRELVEDPFEAGTLL